MAGKMKKLDLVKFLHDTKFLRYKYIITDH